MAEADGGLEEYKILRAKAQEMIKRLDDLERNVILACSAIFVYAVSTQWPNPVSRRVIYFLPFALSVIGWIKYVGLAKYLGQLNKYTASIEQEVLGRPGWLTYYYANPRDKSPISKGEYFFRYFRFLTWIVLMIATFAIGAILFRYGPR